MTTKEVNPHTITRRYAELSASMLTLNQGFEGEMIYNR